MIMAYITSVSIRVLWKPSRGVRQGDPLSSYPFVLCIERLSYGILNAVSAGKWHPITLSRNGVPLSHLFFADDLLLFAEASVEQTSIISSVLDSFCYSFGSKVNKSKTLIYFSKNVGDSEANVISGMLGYSVTKDLGKYLGIPLQHSRVSSCMYQELIAKVERRLSSWTASHLSLAGRITLAQSVLQAISIYVMQTVMLPSGVCDRIDRACRRFI